VICLLAGPASGEAEFPGQRPRSAPARDQL